MSQRVDLYCEVKRKWSRSESESEKGESSADQTRNRVIYP